MCLGSTNNPLSANPKHTQTICWLLPDELFKCVWLFYGVAANFLGVKYCIVWSRYYIEVWLKWKMKNEYV